MTRPRSEVVTTLAVHPTSRGFGWIVFDGPFSPQDWGMVETRQDKNAKCLVAVEKLLNRLQPDFLVLEAFETKSRQCGRVIKLCTAMIALARDRGIEVEIYTRPEIASCFASVGAKSRHEIAEATARHIPSIAHLLPRKRQAWESESRRVSILISAALVVTHYACGANRVLKDHGS